MITRRPLISRALQLAGAALILLPLAMTARAMMQPAVPGSRAHVTFGLYKVLPIALGLALISRGAELWTEAGWSAFVERWVVPSAQRRHNAWRLLLVAIQLGLLLLLVRTFEIENPAFWSRIAPLAFGGWAIHHVTAPRDRQPMFLFLSLLAIWLVFSVPDTLWLITVGVVLVSICHLPVPFRLRVAGVVIAGAALAAARSELLAVPWSRAIWPILGSMFMFRMIVYLYDLRHEKVPAGWPQRLSYFFLLPNVVFPLFPVVDYAAYRRTYYDTQDHVIYQRGVDWIFRGVIQLILYRIVYQFWMIPEADVATAASLGRFMVANFLLYVRVSGQFHLIVGLLHLFGYHLPETHHRYYLASSFADFWRRINIYWKDFMTKVFYYPIQFRLRRWGEKQAMIVATLIVFVMTWALHSYQWYWLLGSFPVTATDTLFWGILAGLLVVNALHEMKHGRRRTLAPTVKSLTPRVMVTRALQTAGTFAAMCVLWSLWMSPTFSAWLTLWSVRGVAEALPSSGAQVALAGVVLLTDRWPGAFAAGSRWTIGRMQIAPARLMSLLVLIGALAVAQPAVSARLGSRVGSLVQSLRSSRADARGPLETYRDVFQSLSGAARR